MTRELCVPCAIRLATTCDIRKTANRRDKITCVECGRRRFGNEYTITEKGANHGADHKENPPRKL